MARRSGDDDNDTDSERVEVLDEDSADPFGMERDDDDDEVALTPEAVVQMLHPSYLQKTRSESAGRSSKNKKHKSRGADLVRRLRKIVHILQREELAVDADDDPSRVYPGLSALAETICHPSFLEDREKDVRLYSLLACLEVLAIYAPDSPFDDEQLILIFQKIIAQVGNLAHAVNAECRNYRQYYRILELLANVKMGIVLVELGRSGGGGGHDDDPSPLSENPVQLLAQLFRTLLGMVHNEHSLHVPEMVQLVVTGCVEEYHRHVPIPLLDEILLCVGSGPTVWAVNPAAHGQPSLSSLRQQKKKDPEEAEQESSPASKSKKNAKMLNHPPTIALSSSSSHNVPLQIEEPNPSYQVAAKILRASENHLATSVSHLLNGLLNGDPHVVASSRIPASLTQRGYEDDDTRLPFAASALSPNRVAAVSSPRSKLSASKSSSSSALASIIFELHRIVPSMLTSVIGTVSGGLRSKDREHKMTVVNLLGRLFAAPHMATHFKACYREWLDLSRDHEPVVRKQMVRHLCEIISRPRPAGGGGDDASMSEAAEDANRTLVGMLVDSDLEVRKDAIYEITDAAFGSSALGGRAAVSASLLRAVGARISSRHSEERRYALTGLAQLHYRNYVLVKLRPILEAGDDCDPSIVLSVIRENCHHLPTGNQSSAGKKRRSRHHRRVSDADPADEAYRWIPRRILEAVTVDDKSDTDTYSRVVQIVDEIQLGNDLSNKNSKKLTPTARAAGLVLILDSLVDEDEDDPEDEDNGNWFREGSASFQYLKLLFGRRALVQSALGRYLEARAGARNLEPGSTSYMIADTEAKALLEKVAELTGPPRGSASLDQVLSLVHGAKDKHIFRLLSMVVDPLQTPTSRQRALTDLPKRTAALGESVSGWIKTLVRRCNMGAFINSSIVSSCVGLARACLLDGQNISPCTVLLSAAKISVSFFPALGAQDETFLDLQELLCDCGDFRSNPLNNDGQMTELLTILTAILKDASQKRGMMEALQGTRYTIRADFRKKLLLLSSRNGSPEQAKNAVYTLLRLTEPSSRENESKSFLSVLTSASRLTVDEGKAPSAIRVMSALAALADCSPSLFTSTMTGRKALQFVMDSILSGHESGSDDESTLSAESDANNTPSPKGRGSPVPSSKKRKHRTPQSSSNLLQDDNLSLPCRRVCAAIEFLVSFVRSSRLRKASDMLAQDFIQQVFDLLAQIVRDGGLPPSNRDRASCRARQNRAALRQCAGLHLLRLCDKRLGLDVVYLTPFVSHILSGLFLDDESVVRDAMVTELCQFLVGMGVFGIEGSDAKPQPPPLRCLAFLALCSDGDHGVDHDPANGSAANIGKLVTSISNSASECCVSLRKVCDGMYAQIRAREPNVEKAAALYERTYKPMLLPEYVVPFVFHLLAHRPETPSAEAEYSERTRSSSNDDCDTSMVSHESQHRILRKRLRLVFDALIRSLGDDANNISFLLRMTEMLEKNYRPIDATVLRSNRAESDASVRSDKADTKRSRLLEVKLQVVCRVARDVLVSLVKKDVNLGHFPGFVLIPRVFAKKNDLSGINSPAIARGVTSKEPDNQSHRSLLKSLLAQGGRDSSIGSGRSPLPASRQAKNRSSFSFSDPESARKVHFSPEIEVKLSAHQRDLLTGDDGKAVSPIAKSESPVRIPGRLSDDDSQASVAAPEVSSGVSSLASTSRSSASTKPPPPSKPVAKQKDTEAKESRHARRTHPQKRELKASAHVEGPVQKQAGKSSEGKGPSRRASAPVAKVKEITGRKLDELDFDFHHPTVENDPPRRRNGSSSGAVAKSGVLTRAKKSSTKARAPASRPATVTY